MVNKRKIKSKLFIILFLSLFNQFASAQFDLNSIHEFDLIDLDIEGKIVGGLRDEYLFQDLESVQFNVSQKILIKGLYETFLRMKLDESRSGIIVTPENGYKDNSTDLYGETLLFNITINRIIHGDSETFTSGVAYVNPKLTRFSDFAQGFGLLIAIVLTTVLLKAVFDYLKLRNQSQLIIR
ncbi:MAG: hypothetical protein HeimC2_04120 [Candidatus Heimdallarchaeota archaeon LC_2]|nr:MAG: hypothetical protein HeimC2_04120 [Candidatus Heimdallarchaeota archaeon LC_2]